LHGELDWIVLKSLEKDRTRRYETASDFAADVQRYLNDEPVMACPPSARYRLRKFARRHRRSLVTGGVIAMALVAATVVSAWQAAVARDAQHQAEADRKQAEADRDRARSAELQAKTEQDRAKTAERGAATEAAIARAVNDFLQDDLLRQVNSGNANLTVKEALDRAAARIDERFRDKPLVEAAIRMAIGQAYHSLLQFELALPHFERAFAVREVHLSPDHPDTLASMCRLALAYSWANKHPDAISLYQRIVKNRETLLGPYHPETLVRLLELAAAYRADRQYDTSVRLLEQLLEKQRTVCGPTHQHTLGTIHELAMTYADMGRLTESMTLHEKLLEGLKSINGPEHESTLWPMMTFAQVCQRAGKLDRADQLLQEALEQVRKRKIASFGTRRQKSDILGWMALNMCLKEKYDDAESLIRETLTFYKKERPDSSRTFYWESVFGAILLGQQRYTEAELHLLQGYEGIKQRETTHRTVEIELVEAGERVVRFYEVTNQPEKARMWREKVKPKQPDAQSDGVK
jgi:eukaryotic-like serine/threonine-protein kinase